MKSTLFQKCTRLINKKLIGVMMLGVFVFCLNAQQQGKTEDVLRLTVKYVNGQMQVTNVKKLRMILPLTVKEQIISEGKDPYMMYYEITDSNNKLLLRSEMEEPTAMMEYEDPEKPGKIISKEIILTDTEFSILVPAVQNSRYINFKQIEQLKDSTKRTMNIGSSDLHK